MCSSDLLDYATWVLANEADIRARMGWPGRPPEAGLHVHFVVAPKRPLAAEAAADAYFAGQLEALSGDLRWRVWLVEGFTASTVQVRPLRVEELWAGRDGLPTPMQPQRWAQRVQQVLAG